MPVGDPGGQGSGSSPLVGSERRSALRDWVPSIVEEIVDGFRPRRVILFGSIARGEEAAESDVDLMVVFDHLDPARRADLQGKLMAAITAPVPFDVFVLDVDEYEAKKDVNGTSGMLPRPLGGREGSRGTAYPTRCPCPEDPQRRPASPGTSARGRQEVWPGGSRRPQPVDDRRALSQRSRAVSTDETLRVVEAAERILAAVRFPPLGE